MLRPVAFGHDVYPIKSDGTKGDRDGIEAKASGYTLASSTSYYYDLGPSSREGAFQSVHVKWDSAAILTITIEDSNFTDVTVYDTTAGNWLLENPSTAYIANKSTDASTGGSTVTNATVAVAGGTAGGCFFNIGMTGAMRTRLKIAVGGTGGVVRVSVATKES
jgi:hypothetical protein